MSTAQTTQVQMHYVLVFAKNLRESGQDRFPGDWTHLFCIQVILLGYIQLIGQQVISSVPTILVQNVTPD